MVTLVYAAQDVRRPARCLSPHGEPHCARCRDQVRGVGREDSLGAGRRAAPAHDEHRVRRDERGAGRPLCGYGRRALALPLLQVRASRLHRSVAAPRGRPCRHARQHPGAQAHRLGGPLRVRWKVGGSPGRELLLGPGCPASQLLERRTRQGRVLRPAGPAERLDRRPDVRDVQHLQHAQADQPAVFRVARSALRRLSRARAVQPHPRVHRSRGRARVLHGAGGWRAAGRAARVPGHVSRLHVRRRHRHGAPRPAQ